MLLEEKELYEFGSFRLDVSEHIFSRIDGVQNGALPEKSFQTLCVLVRNHGRLLTKHELLDQVWPDSFVEENNLDKCIHAIRQILGEKPGEHKFIETVRKHGYRFVADVRRIEVTSELEASKEINRLDVEVVLPSGISDLANGHAAEALKSNGSLIDSGQLISHRVPEAFIPVTGPTETVRPSLISSDKELPRRNRFWPITALAVLVAGTIGIVSYFLFTGGSTIDSKKSIAVLPFKPINSASRDEIYEIGIADSLILKLSSMKGLVVRPLSATRKYAGIEQDPLVAGREQQADYVLASNYQLAGGRIRVTAQLFNVANGQIEETYKSEQEATNVFAMQDAIAGEVGNILSARFVTTSRSPTAKRGTSNEEAYRLYLQGMYLYGKRTLADAQKAVEVLEQAVKLDPNYALAWAGKSHAHRSVANFGRNDNIHEEYQKSMEAVNKALALDENLADAYSAMCENKMYYEYDFDEAERACKRAIGLDPNSSLAHQIYSRYLNSRGRSDEAIAESKTAIDLEPTSLLNQRVYGTCLYFARRYEEAAAQLKRVIAMDKNFANAYMWLRFALEMQGNESEVFEWFMKAPSMQNADEETVQAFKTAYQTSGWQGVLRERVKRFDKGDESYFHGAAYNSLVGNKDQAFEYLNKSYQRRELWMANLRIDPRLDGIRDDPRYKEMLDRVESK